MRDAQGEDCFGVLVDALPTLGKSRTVATVLSEPSSLDPEGEVDLTVLTHRKDTREQLIDWARDAGVDVLRLPVFDEDCPTASGEFGEEWSDRVGDLRSRGVSSAQIHSDPRYDLPCSEDGKCPYVGAWEDSRERRLLVGHPTHAYVTEVVRNRVVVFDEDPGDAFLTKFDPNALNRIVPEYLSTTEEVVWDAGDGEKVIETLGQLETYRQLGGPERVRETVEQLQADDCFGDPELVGRVRGHGDARAVVIALLEPGEDVGNGANRVELPNGAVGVRDERQGRLYVRRPPDLTVAAGVVGLDGTPVHRIWEGRLGCPPEQHIRYRRVLCDDCRSRYLEDVLGYRVYQTSTHVKPYSSGRNLNTEKDLALVEAVYRETGREPAVISSKAATRVMERAWEHVRAHGHYGAMKGSNDFEGEPGGVGVVVGSRHPGDHEVKRVAALNGDSIDIPEKRQDRGKNLGYGVEPRDHEPSAPYLSHFREHHVVQAILRFGRNHAATVYVHTGAVPEWILTDGPIQSERDVLRRVRSDGEREVVNVLAREGPLTVAEICDRVEIAQRTVYEKRDDLREDGLVVKHSERQPHKWALVEEGVPSEGHLVNDRWYVVLPGEN